MADPTGPNLKPYMRKLRDLYDRLVQERASIHEGIDESLLEETGEITAIDNHPADTGTELYLRERDGLMERNLDEMIAQCERALQKIDEGTYGYSDISGDFIGLERLDALPYATLTVAEQERTANG